MTESSETVAFITVLITVKVKEFNDSTGMRDVTKSLDDGRVESSIASWFSGWEAAEKTY